MDSCKILFLAANPTDTARLRLDKECQQLRERIRLAKHRDQVKLESRWAVRTRDITQALLEETPRIIHFCGHGEKDRGLVFEDDHGEPKIVTKEALTAVLKVIKDQLRLAVFNACDSLPLAQEAVEVLDAAIGMNQPIGDRAAITFAAALYGRKDLADDLENGLALEGSN